MFEIMFQIKRYLFIVQMCNEVYKMLYQIIFSNILIYKKSSVRNVTNKLSNKSTKINISSNK